MKFISLEKCEVCIVTYKDLKSMELERYVFFDKTDASEEIWLKLPYKPNGFTITYEESEYLDIAKEVMIKESLDKNMPNGSVFVRDGHIVASGANGSDFHLQREKEMLLQDQNYSAKGCIRKERNISTGQRYDLCPGCSTKNHGEAKIILKLQALGKADLLKNSTNYLYGHWWCCQSCCGMMEESGVAKVVLSKSWTKNFLNLHPLY